MFAIKEYDNPQAVGEKEFYDDMKRFKYLKRLFKKYSKTGILKERLIMNHIIVLQNVFGPDVDSFIHPIEDTGIFLHWISNGQITKENFWNGSSMETYQNHDFFKTESVNSIDDMSHWERYSEDIKNFSRDYRKTKLDWGIKLCTSLTP